MNKTDKNLLGKYEARLIAMREEVDQMHSEMEDMLARHDEVFSNRSEKWQESDKGEEAQAEMSAVEDITSALNEISDQMETAIDAIQDRLSE